MPPFIKCNALGHLIVLNIYGILSSMVLIILSRINIHGTLSIYKKRNYLDLIPVKLERTKTGVFYRFIS